MSGSLARANRLRRYWDAQADRYDARSAPVEGRFFGDVRQWLCRQASGDVLEVAVGTGRNLQHYPDGTRVTGVDWSADLLAIARRRADDAGRTVDLRVADAQALPFPDRRFDSVVCTFALCCIPDDRLALAELVRVLRPGGLLLLADHVASTAWPVRVLQTIADAWAVPRHGEHFRRRPLLQVRALGLDIEQHDRYALGMIERLAARKSRTSGDGSGRTSPPTNPN